MVDSSDIKPGTVIKSIYTKTVRTIIRIDEEFVICTDWNPALNNEIYIHRDKIINYWKVIGKGNGNGQLHG